MANVWRRKVLKLFRTQKEKVSLSVNNGERTLDACFPPDKPSRVSESNPISDDESISEDKCGKNGQKIKFSGRIACTNLTSYDISERRIP